MLYGNYLRQKMRHLAAFKEEAAEGVTPFDITTNVAKPLKNYRIYGNSDGVGDLVSDGNYKIPFTVISGKNLFDVNNHEYGLVNSDGTENKSSIYLKSYYIPINIPATVSFTCGQRKDAIRMGLYRADKSFITRPFISSEAAGTRASYKITQSGAKYVKLSYAVKGSAADTEDINSYFYDVMVENSGTLTDYEAFRGQTAIIYINSPLYANDYIDFATKKVVRGSAEESISLPVISLQKGANKIFVATKTAPSNVQLKYLIK